MSPAPTNVNQAVFQERINQITGTRDSRPLILLAWAPDELRWTPHKLGDEPVGYTFPIFCTGKDESGQFKAPERWVLLERIEPEQYAADWEGKRYANWHGTVYDVKGPCPSEKYVELRCHSYHDGVCCPCFGDSCECGEAYNHCWGKYVEPDEHLLDWIRKTAWEARQDSDVQPTTEMKDFQAPNAQQELAQQVLAEHESRSERFKDLDKETMDYWVKQPHSTSRRTAGGIYLPD